MLLHHVLFHYVLPFQLLLWPHWGLVWSFPWPHLCHHTVQHRGVCPSGTCTSEAQQKEDCEFFREKEIHRYCQDTDQHCQHHADVWSIVAVWCFHNQRCFHSVQLALCHLQLSARVLPLLVLLCGWKGCKRWVEDTFYMWSIQKEEKEVYNYEGNYEKQD